MAYSYQINLASGTTVHSMDRKTIGALKEALIKMQSGSFAKSNIEEIIVYRGNKIHGFYDENFKLNKSIPVDINDILLTQAFGL